MKNIKICGKVNTTTLAAHVSNFFMFDYDASSDTTKQLTEFMKTTILPEIKNNLGPDYEAQVSGILNGQGDVLYEALTVLKYNLDKAQAEAGVKSIGLNSNKYVGGPMVDQMFVGALQDGDQSTNEEEDEDSDNLEDTPGLDNTVVQGGPSGLVVTTEEKTSSDKTPTPPPTVDQTENQDGTSDIEGADSSSSDDVEIAIQDTLEEIGFIRNLAPIEGMSMTHILKTVFPGEKKLFFDKAVKYFKDLVSKQWIDTQVVDGKVVGFTSLADASTRVLNKLKEKVAGLNEKTANRTIRIVDSNNNQEYTYYFYDESNPAAKQCVKYPADEVSISQFADNLHMPPAARENSIAIVGTEEELTEVVKHLTEKENTSIISDEVNDTPTELNYNTYLDERGDIQMTNEEEFHSTILSQYYDTFLSTYYPGLSKAYQSNHRTGFVKDESVTALDQDSAVLKMHKLTTPRLIQNEAGGLIQDKDHPYLYEQDYINVMDTLTTMPRDIEGFRTALIQAIDSKPTHKEVLVSIYNRFFNEGEYSYTNNNDEEVTHVSYDRLTNKYASEAVPLSVFNRNKGEWTQNAMLNNSLSGLITSFTSSAVREKFMSKNGKATPTNSLTGVVMSDFEDKMVSSTSITNAEGNTYTDSTLFSNKKKGYSVSFSSPINNRYNLTFVQGGQKYAFKMQINVNQKGDGFVDGIPVTILEQPDGMSTKILTKLLRDLHLPHNLFGREFVDAFNSKAQLDTLLSGNPNALAEFYLGLVHLMKCNTDTGREYASGAKRSVEIADGVPYRYNDNISGYKSALATAMNDTFGPLQAKFIKNLNGDRLALNIVKTKWDDVKRLIRMAKQNAGSINASSSIVNGPITVDGLYSKAGVSLNGMTKANSELTLHESNQLLIEQAYLQMMGQTGNFTKAMFQMGTMSDRSDVPLVAVTHSGTFLPVIDGKYDATPLRAECYRTHVAHHRGNLRATQKAWAEVFKGEGITPSAPLESMDAVTLSNEIKAQMFDYGQIKADYPVVSNISIDKTKINGKSVAIMPEGTVQNCIIFDREDSPLLHSYMESSKFKYLADLEAMGYSNSPLSDESNEILARRFPNMTKAERKTALFDSYFYNSNVVGHSLLQLHTGGYSQFAAKRVAPSKYLNSFVYDTQTKSYKLDPTAVNETIAALKELTIDEIIEEYGTDSDELYYKKIVDSKNIVEDNKPYVIVFDEISKTNHAKFIDQSKRNAMSGSGVQTPRMVGHQEPGSYIGNFSKAITFSDPAEDILLLGAVESTEQDAYDAVMCGHPMYFIKHNNSLGASESNFATKGEPIKDITNEVDANGHHRGQKKATFPIFHNEILKKGSAELYNLFMRMNTAVPFEGADSNIFVDRLADDFSAITYSEDDYSTVVTPEIWKQNGHALGEVLVVQEDGSKLVYNTKALLAEGFEFLENALNSGRVLTAKVEKKFNNLHDLWEYFGSIDNDNAWEQVSNVIGNYTGRNCNSILLKDSASELPFYTLRDAYIEKAGFATQEKMGNKNVLPAGALTDPTYDFTYQDKVDPSITRPRYSEIDNTFHGTILSAGHDFDTSATTKSDVFATDEHEDHAHDATVSLITQIISANIAQGESLAESRKIYSTLGAMSNSVLDSIRRKISNTILREAVAVTEDFDVEGFYSDIMQSTSITNRFVEASLKRHGVADPEAVINKGYAEYAKDIVKTTLSSRETGSIASEIVNQDGVDNITFDLKQMLPLTQSALNAEFNRKAVRNKFPGMQFVVAPSHDFIHMYSLKNADGTIYRKNLTRDKLNEVAYDVEGDQFWGDVQSLNFPESPITVDNLISVLNTNVNGADHKRVAQVTATDYVIIAEDFGPFREGDKVRLSTVISNTKRMLADAGQRTDATFLAQALDSRLTWKLGKFTDDTKGTLTWQSYKRVKTDAEGNSYIQDFTEVSEYKMFKAIIPTTKLHKKGSKIQEDFVQGNSEFTTPEEVLNASEAVYNSVDAGLRNVVTDVVKNGVSYDAALVRYSNGMRQDGDNLLSPREVAEIITEEYNKDKEFIKIFEAGAQNVLSDKDANWTTDPAEFYLPPMHQVAYMIDNNDSIADIVGLQEQPDKNDLIRAGILDYDGAWEIDNNFNDFNRRFKFDKKYNMLSKTQKTVYDRFVRLKTMQLSRMSAFFSEKLDKLIDDANIFNPSNIRGVSKVSNLNNLILHAKTLLNKSKYGTAEYKLWQNVLHGTTVTTDPINQSAEELGLYDLRKYKRLKNNRELRGLIDVNNFRSAAYAYRNQKLDAVINSFPASLEFISARIPAQGKQSYIAGVTSEFIYSSRNSCYGPLEMLTATGADYDIDKQNMMTWAVNANGKITDWKPFLGNDGIISVNRFKQLLTQKQAEMRSKHDMEYQMMAESLENRDDLADDKKARILEKTKKNQANAIKTLTKSFEEEFTQGCQNFVVYNLLKTIKDPKNAIEAATPMAMEKARGSIKPTDYSKISANPDLYEVLKARGHAMPYAPTTMIEYERLNMDGKTGVGIFASDLKAYFAIYYAFISDADSEYTRFASNISDADLQSIKQDNKVYNINNNGLVFFAKNPDGSIRPQTLKTLSNAFRYTSKNKMITEEARSLASDLRQTPAEEQEALINERLDSVITSNRMMTEEQAWEDLSELLSASTDNAKELILGRIGANALTSSIISSMIRCGVDIKDALELINSPEIKALVEEVQISQDTQKTKSAYEKSGVLESKQLKALVEKKAKSVAKDNKLAYHSNPYVQFLRFVNITEEFSLVSAALSINQGIKNDAYSMWSYIKRIEDGINDVIGTKKDAKPFKFKAFVDKIIASDGNPDSDILDIIQAYDAKKSGINVPYVLYMNSHYLGYFSAMFESKSIRDVISNVYGKVERVIEDLDVPHVSKDAFNGIADYMYGVGIDEFLRKTEKIISVNGKVYDLRYPDSGLTGVPGRAEFVQQLPQAVSDALNGELSDNYFLQAISLSSEEPDYATGAAIKLLKARDLNKMDPTERARMQLGLNDPDLKKTDLYNALYLYSLITNKGSYTQGSFISLFPVEHYNEYMQFIKANSDIITDRAINKGTRDAFLLNNKLLLPKTATDKESLIRLRNSKKAMTDMEISDMIDSEFGGVPDDFDFMRKKRESKYAEMFNPEAINRKFLKNSEKNPFVTSVQTGVVYGYNETYNLYLPLTQVNPRVSIPYSVQNENATLREAGFMYGIPVDIESGVSGRILGYADSYLIDAMEDAEVDIIKTEFDPELAPDELPDNSYLVESNGKVYAYTKDALLALNKDRLALNKYAIRKLSMAGEVTKAPDELTTLYFDGSTFNSVVTDRESNVPVEIRVPYDKRATLNSPLSNDPKTKKRLNSTLKFTGIKASKMDMQEYYEHLRKIHTASIIANEISTPGSSFNIPTVLSYMKDPDNLFVQAYLDEAMQSVNNKYPANPTKALMLDLVLKSTSDPELTPHTKELKLISKDLVPRKFKTDLKAMVENGALSYGSLENISKIWGLNTETTADAISFSMQMQGIDMYVGDKTMISESLNEQLREELADSTTRYQALHMPSSMRINTTKSVSTPVLRKVAKYLNDRFPDTTVKVLSTAEIASEYDDVNPNVKAFVRNGDVVINMDNATLDTPIHEFAHIYFEHLKIENSALFDSLVEKALQDPMAVEMRKSYKTLSNPDLAEEILVQKIADYVSGKYGKELTSTNIFGRSVESDGSMFGRIVQWFKDLFGKMFRTDKDPDFTLGASLSEVLESYGDSIIYKKGSPLHDFSEATRAKVKSLRNNTELDLDTAYQHLVDRGFIQKVCI